MATRTTGRSSGKPARSPRTGKTRPAAKAARAKRSAPARAAAKPVRPARPAPKPARSAATRKGVSSAPAPAAKSATRSAAASAKSAPRGTDPIASLLKELAPLLGPAQPANKGLDAQGNAAATEAGSLRVLQFGARPDRMSWIYLTHGLSLVPAEGHNKPFHAEFALHMKTRDPKGAAKVLHAAAQHVLRTGVKPGTGDFLASDAETDLACDGLLHWIVCPADRALPAPLKLAHGTVQPLLLVGITSDEMNLALKVRPELANGRLVLVEALRAAGVMPITDPKRACMTRRRDFHRIWEACFRAVRERTAPVL